MKTLEIIHLRFASDTPQNLVEIIHKYIGAGFEKVEIRIFSNMKLDSDLAVHLMRETDVEDSGASDAGIRLSTLLRDYGMVAHSVWKEWGGLAEGSLREELGRGEREG
jgi:hypothetical protein